LNSGTNPCNCIKIETITRSTPRGGEIDNDERGGIKLLE
jgi:hypothetical protein